MSWMRLAVAAAMVLFPFGAIAQQQPQAPSPPPIDFSKVEIKTTNLGDGIYMLEGQGGNITVAVAKDGIIMVDSEYAALHDKIKAAISAISNQPVKYLIDTHFHEGHAGGNEASTPTATLMSGSRRPTFWRPATPSPTANTPISTSPTAAISRA
jgi:glyoxylase-like metal-dependent hydrolase (beta-lactamase superfamily II)